MNIKRLFIPLVGILFCSEVFGQNDSTIRFSLIEAQNYAIDNFYMSQNSKLDIKSAKKKIWETTAVGLPQLTADARYDHIPGEIPTLDFGMDALFEYIFGSLTDAGYPPPNGLLDGMQSGAQPIAERDNLTYNILLNQLIFSGEYIVGLRASRVYSSLAEETNEKIELELKQTVANGYFSMLTLQKTQNILQKTLNNTIKIEENTRQYYETGLADETDADQVTLLRKRLESELNTVERQLLYMDKIFKYSVGLAADVNVELTDSLETLIGNSIVNDSMYTYVLENNIDYRILDTQEQLMKLAMDREKSKYLPTVSGFYKYTDQANTPAFNTTINNIIGIQVSVPIFESGSKMMKVQQARINYMKAQNEKEQESEKLIADADQALLDYESALEKYYYEKQGFELSEKILNKTTEKYNNGMASSIDLTTVNNQYLESQLNYSLALQALLNAKVKLDKIYSQL
jgi:outer membrane protein